MGMVRVPSGMRTRTRLPPMPSSRADAAMSPRSSSSDSVRSRKPLPIVIPFHLWHRAWPDCRRPGTVRDYAPLCALPLPAAQFLLPGVRLILTTPRRAPVPRRRWWMALLLAFGVVIAYFDRINLSISREALHTSFGLSLVSFGYLSSAFSWTYAVMQVPSGVLLDRFGIRRVGLVGALLWSIASFLASISPGLGLLFGARLLLGLAEAPIFPATAKATGVWFRRSERSLAVSLTDAAAKFSSA